ncbi:MAG TPA: ABC transporter substrate-binding protein [Gemmatimonadales bacterium]|nr:ABC transporter substrate-binding protein [Gemmatimonadales bacterium]
MARWTLGTWLGAGLALTATVAGAPGAAAQAQADPSRIVILVGGEAFAPVPTLNEGAQTSAANTDLADQMFLHLAELGPTLLTAGDKAFEPALARSWTRRDSVTLVFDLDPRATWQDGVPVTAQDVVFTFTRARNPTLAPRLSNLLRRIASVTAEGDRRVVFRYTRPYGEQLYDAVFHAAPLPAHLLARIPPDSLAMSSFAQAPVGNGPYRWVRRVPGQVVELEANPRFFLGPPAIRHVFYRLATDAQARLNLLLGGEADAIDVIPAPRSNVDRVTAQRNLRIVSYPTSTLGFLLFNQRDPRDRERPHPILSDHDVRRAIGLALDRRRMLRTTFGTLADVPYGPASALLWISHGSPEPAGQNVPEARRLLSARGWADHDGDGTLDKDGIPLALTILLPSSSAFRLQLAQIAQEQLRQIGIRVELVAVEFSLYNERRSEGRFDIDFAATLQDPSPTGLTQGWSCAGGPGTNVARYCDPQVDSLIEAATFATTDVQQAWHAVLRRIEADAPAVFMYAPTFQAVVDRRFGNVRIRPESLWLGLRQWTVSGRSVSRPVGY